MTNALLTLLGVVVYLHVGVAYFFAFGWAFDKAARYSKENPSFKSIYIYFLTIVTFTITPFIVLFAYIRFVGV